MEETASKLIFNTQSDSSQYKVSTSYDVLDRILSITQPDTKTTTSSYGIEDNQLVTSVTDALKNTTKTYTNGSGLTTKTVQRPGSNAIVTLLQYNSINQLVKVIDAMGKKTTSEYDKAGRRTSVTHPASGETKFVYDAAGNLVVKKTANLLKTGDSILYEYDYNRLRAIKYPHHPENDVTYTYGSATDTSSFNRKGRLVTQEDGSGRQEFKYGRQGELTEVSRTLVIPNHAVATYTTRWDYDSWNRLQSMTYPDGEVVNYSYNTGGLLTGVASSSNVYVADVKYDKFEQRTYLRYGNGKETKYTYDNLNRHLKYLKVGVGEDYIMNNAYTYDAVGNIRTIENTGIARNAANTMSHKIGGKIIHNYEYDNLYRLDSAYGDFNLGDANQNVDRNANYHLKMQYDNMHNIIRKKQSIEQTGIQFAGTLQAGYDLNYTINANNSQQISNIAENSYRTEGTGVNTPTTKTSEYSYDANGNLIYMATGTVKDDKLQATNTRKLLWDEENRLLGISDNGFVSQYWYDASGERTVKESFDNEGVYINGALSGARTGASKFTAYISPYMVVSQGGNYTKHVYMGSQRITSKVSNSGIFVTNSPVNVTELQAKLSQQTTKIKERFDSLGVKYNGTTQTGGLVSSSPATTADSYFYHPDHLGSSSLITSGSGDLVQHIQYVPFGEVFVEERNATWSTPYKFNGKEQDEETGLCYYGARYYDPRTSVWLSVDPLAEKYPNISSYVYCVNNPVKFVDPDGRALKTTSEYIPLIMQTLPSHESKYVTLNIEGFIDQENMRAGVDQLGNVSANYLALLEIVENIKIVEFYAPQDKTAVNANGENISGNNISFPFRDPVNDEYSNGMPELVGGIGITLAPSTHQFTENDNNQRKLLPENQRYSSSNGNYQVQINGRGLKFKSTFRTLVQATAHELYGHLLMMFRGKDALHTSIRSGEGLNAALEKQIYERVNEATQNYDIQNQ